MKDYEFFRNPTGRWVLFFDVDKIVKLVKEKKTFDHQIISDGVPTTELSLKPDQEETECISNEKILRQY